MNSQRTMELAKSLERSQAPLSEEAVVDDRLLVAEAKSGGANAFGALYERHRSKIYRVALRILRNEQDAEDALQQSFQRGFTNLSRFREDATFSTWMTRIAINESLMLLRQRKANKVRSEKNDDGRCADLPFELPDDRPTPEQTLAETEVRSAVSQAISKLRHKLRAVVLLREVHGLTSVETARCLGLTVGTVKARVYHARRHLRRHLEHQFEGALAGKTLLAAVQPQSVVNLSAVRPLSSGSRCAIRPHSPE